MKGYVVIQDWMLDLDLDVWETMVYATIFSFSQDGESTFNGSQKFLARKAKCSRNKIVKCLDTLIEMGLVDKIDNKINGVNFPKYRVSPVGTGCTHGVQGCTHGVHNNKDINIDVPSISIYKGESLEFFKNLISLGVTEEVATAWMEIRKKKKASNSAVAFKEIRKEIEKSGRTADECIRIAVKKDWRGFEAEWLEKNSTPLPAPQQRESVFDHNRRVAQEMFGRSYDEQ